MTTKGHQPVDSSLEELPEDEHPLFGSDDDRGYVVGSQRRADRHRPPRRKRRHLITPVIAFLVIIAVLAGGWIAVGKLKDRFTTPDYSGMGQTSVTIQVQPGDGADAIGATLVQAGVVKSVRAFTNAAKNSGQAGDIQPGTYRMRLRSSGTAAMSEILDPANRLVSKVTVPEGYTYKQVFAQVEAKTGIKAADLDKAAANLSSLGIPTGVSAKSVEGLLFPATYDFDPSTTAATALQTMITKFSAEYVTLGVAAKAAALKLTPYQVLIIASIAEAEAKFGPDRAKVARVIMNRIAIQRPLQVDATSAYAAKLEGKDPASVVYATMNTPYNSYTHPGLPPTPIGNPGDAAITSALNPPAGDWLFYVNIDAAGHLGFFTDENAFIAAAAKCKAEGWGCG